MNARSCLALALTIACDRSEPIPAPPPPREEKPAVAEKEAERASKAKADVAMPAVEDAKRVVTFDQDADGGPAAGFEAVIGDWYVGELEGARGLWVDGTRWRAGTPSAGLADQAKRLYGDQYAEFLDNVKAFAFYPVAVWTGDAPQGDMKIAVRFYPDTGRIDQAAGIVWSLSSDGKYWGVRANALEDNLLYFDVVRGKRTVRTTIRGVSTPTRTWHTLEVVLQAGEVVVTLDGEERLRQPHAEPIAGRVGLWTKADSKVLFDDFTVEPLPPS